MFMLPLLALLMIVKDDKTDFFSAFILTPPSILFTVEDFNCHHSLWDSKGIFDPRGEEVFDRVNSSDLFPLNGPDIPTLLHRSSPDIFFAPFSFVLSCSWEVIQDLGSDHLLILLSSSGLSPQLASSILQFSQNPLGWL